MLEVTTPFDLSVIGHVEWRNWAQIDHDLAVAHALHANKSSWLPLHQRAAILKKTASLMTARFDELAFLIANEGGKPLVDARVEVARAIDGVELCVKELSHLDGRQIPMDLTPAGANKLAFTFKEPIGPVVRQGDERWADVVRWTLNAMILAEQSKLNSRDVEDARQNSVEPQVRRLLGVEGDAGRRLGLADDWAFKVIRQVGAYDEVFERHLGANTPLKMERGRNALWNADKPGQLYAPPLR